MVWAIRFSQPLMALAAPHRRSSWNCIICIMKPMPSWPIRLRRGTRTSSKNTWAVSELRMPSLLSGLSTVMPPASLGTTIRDLLTWGLSSEVLASRQKKSALGELVIHILVPLIT